MKKEWKDWLKGIARIVTALTGGVASVSLLIYLWPEPPNSIVAGMVAELCFSAAFFPILTMPLWD